MPASEGICPSDLVHVDLSPFCSLRLPEHFSTSRANWLLAGASRNCAALLAGDLQSA
jgi:hypothetical protein